MMRIKFPFTQKFHWAFMLSIIFLHSLNGQIILNNYDTGVKLDQENKKYFMEPFKGRFARITADGYFGLIDSTGKIVLPVQYDFISDFEVGSAVIKLDGKQGLIDKQGNIIIPVKYDYVEPFYHGAAVVGLYNKYALMNAKGEEITPFKYDEMTGSKQGIFEAKYEWLPYVLDSLGREIELPADAFNVWEIYPNGIILLDTEHGFMFIHSNGRELTKVNKIVNLYAKLYSSEKLILDCLSPNLFSIRLDSDKMGLIDSLGNELLTFEYNDIKNFSSTGLILEKNGKCTLVDYEFKTILPYKYDQLEVFERDYYNIEYGSRVRYNDSLLLASVGGKRGIINTTGKIKVPIIYDDLSVLENGLIIASKNDMQGLVDINGEIVLALIYDEIYYLGDASYLVRTKGMYMLLSTQGKISPLVANRRFYTSETTINGLLRIYNESGSQVGCMDRYGNMVIPIDYDHIYFAESGLALARKNGNVGYIDAVGTTIIPFKFGTHSMEFEGRLARVSLNNQLYYINKKGEVFLDEALTKKYTPVEKKEDPGADNGLIKDCGFDPEVYVMSQTPPEFPGGEEAMQDFIYSNLIYPDEAKKNTIEGMVWVDIIINCNGNVIKVDVIRGIGGGCDEEAARVLLTMPRWKPGMVDNETVNFKWRIKVNFVLK
jgi:TonB family protein